MKTECTGVDSLVVVRPVRSLRSAQSALNLAKLEELTYCMGHRAEDHRARMRSESLEAQQQKSKGGRC